MQRSQKRRLLRVLDSDVRQLFEQGGAVGGDGNEKARMVESDMQRAVAAHGDSADAARRAFRSDAVIAFDERNEFL